MRQPRQSAASQPHVIRITRGEFPSERQPHAGKGLPPWDGRKYKRARIFHRAHGDEVSRFQRLQSFSEKHINFDTAVALSRPECSAGIERRGRRRPRHTNPTRSSHAPPEPDTTAPRVARRTLRTRRQHSVLPRRDTARENADRSSPAGGAPPLASSIPSFGRRQ